MAFNSNAAPAQSNDNWKAQGFLNFYLPSKDGGKRRKLGAIPLKNSKDAEAKLMDWLNEDPSRAAKILANLELEYQSAAPSDTAGFMLD